MEMNFCRRCGAPLHNVEGHVFTCNNDHTIFGNASPASALFIINDQNEVLMAVRAREPGLGKMDVPGGFNDGAEISEDAITRELAEEIGFSPSDYSTPKYLASGIDTYSYKGEVIDVLDNMFYAHLIGEPVIHPQDDVAEARFIPIDSINPDEIYFHSLRKGLTTLRSLLRAEQS
jgi:ADP-ribose pyrophosphatase YjhB (NUDIX family)